MLTLRFVRRGRKKFAFFDLVVAEKARAVQKKFIDKLGYYNPHTNKGEVVFDADLVKKYIAQGAQMSQRVARELVKNGVSEAEKFIEKRATKPKKEAPKPEEPEETEPSTEAAEAPEEAS